MNIAIDVFNYVFTALLIGVFLAWLSLLTSMFHSFTKTPFLNESKNQIKNLPKVSVILPARNEEDYVGKCLDSLLQQDYKNFEVVVINDSSEDRTEEIIHKFSKNNEKIIAVNAKPKPDKWMGKNWACIEGFKHATGELLLFTDADTKFSKNLISLATKNLISERLDALTVIPRLKCIDYITKITLPMLSVFLHSRYSALKVNDPKKKIGYFFGSFYIIKREVYEKVGTHEIVKQEIIEDGALGKIVKESGFSLKMMRGEENLEALYSRSPSEMWNGLKRLMVPLYHQNSTSAVGVFFAVLFILFMPIPFLIYSIIFFETSFSFFPLFIASILSTLTIYTGAIMEVKMGLKLNITNAILSPIGGLIVVCGFLSGILHANRTSSVSWRGRKYTIKEFKQDYLKL